MKKLKYARVGIIVMTLILSIASSFGSLVGDSNNAEMFWEHPVSQGPILEVTTDKTVYNVSEPVIIFLTNIGDETLSAGGPTITIYNEDEEIVYQEATYCWYELDPGEYIEWPPWTQTNQQGQQVPVGKYVVEGFLSGGDENYVDTATFYIINYEPPGPPYGPNEGTVGEEYTFCFDLPMNPECEPYYIIWDWGDGSLSEWSGPYTAGLTVCETHSWDEPGNYEIKIGLKDGVDNEYWSDPLIITIHPAPGPKLEIVKIRGGLGIRTYIKNIGNETPNKVYFWLEHGGGIFVRLHRHGTSLDPIRPGETVVYWTKLGRFGISFGFLTEPSWFTITIEVEQDQVSDVESFNALVFGPFVSIQ
ncbi:hypothetical protein AYK25_01670 [Thermoplasmatales archaeon SM1-50]|nr:MAG: hypothetical protein AYK25_01670 [Thermoplasmatales archaeon SM1-50]